MSSTVTVSFFFCLALLFCSLPSTVATADGPVIIIGAGVAGAKLAFEFHRAGVPFVLLEATGRVGGRLRQGQLYKGGPKVELGGNWVQGGRSGDPYFELIQTMKLSKLTDNFDDYYFYDNGRKVPDSVADPAWERFEEAKHKLFRFRRDYARGPNNETLHDMSVEDALLLAGGWAASSTLDLAVLQSEIDYEYAHRASMVSIHEVASFEDPDEPPSQSYFVNDQRGFRLIVLWLLRRAGIPNVRASGPRLKLRAAVRSINYGNAGASVELWDGRKIEGSAVVSTVSLGVLKLSMEHHAPGNVRRLQFDPPLPFPKRVAISKQAMGTYLKMFIKFNRPVFTNADPIYIRPLSCRENYAVSLHNLNHRGYLPGENIVLYTATGSLGRELQCISREERLRRALDSIALATGRKIRRWEVHSVIVSPFLESPYFRGMFSMRGLGVSDEEMRNFNGPVGNLFFAGEAHHQSQGFVQSAYYSAEKTAEDVINFLHAPRHS